jgi:predicted amidophosphoribosyltransferase
MITLLWWVMLALGGGFTIFGTWLTLRPVKPPARRLLVRGALYCQRCGAVMTADSRFCGACGRRLGNTPARPRPVQQQKGKTVYVGK